MDIADQYELESHIRRPGPGDEQNPGVPRWQSHLEITTIRISQASEVRDLVHSARLLARRGEEELEENPNQTVSDDHSNDN